MRLITVAAALVAMVGCTGKMSTLEALEALEQARISGEGEAATAEPIEVSTDFTIGEGLAQAAQALAAWWQSQMPCSEVTWDDSTVSVDFGELGDACQYNGHTFAGLTDITVQAAGPTEVHVDHEWTGFRNEDIQVDGGATVTWSGDTNTRRVITDHVWTDEVTTVKVAGDHVYGFVDEANWLDGFTLEGTRDWDHEGVPWHLDMEGIELRLQDPVPQSGVYRLVDPEGRELLLTFERQDEGTIRVTFEGTWRGLVVDVNRFGFVEEV